MNDQPILFAVHGFLGLPSDWDYLNYSPIEPLDLAQFCFPSQGFNEWARTINARAKITPGKKILMGYSLGGRLAMHAILQCPDQWDAAILISSHPGLDSTIDRQKRLESDLSWAERFKKDAWEKLLEDWNNQSAFNGSCATPRFEASFSREFLAAALSHWSLARQDSLLHPINNLSLPILWIAGSRDFAYAERANAMKLKHARSKIWAAPNAGHRVPWDTPLEFKQQIHQFIHS